MWYEVDIDALMVRTRHRPLPMGYVTLDSALAFGLILGGGSIFLMAISVNYLAAALLAFSILFYSVIYTMLLKPRTPQNIVIGGVAGALPPLIGWVSVTGSLAIPPLVMVGIIFLWTVPHFWSLAIVKHKDYERAGIPMMPNVYGIKKTKLQVILYSVLMVFCSLLLNWIGFSHNLYLWVNLFTGIIFIILSFAVYFQKGWEMRLFTYSILYLFVLFFTLVLDQMVCL